MRRLLDFLLYPSTSLPKYCLYLVPLALVPSIGFYSLAMFLFGVAGGDVTSHSAPALVITLGNFLGVVVFAPVVETVLLSGLLKRLLSTPLRPTWCALVSAVLWGGIHGVLAGPWFFGTVWSFFVFSCGYISWRRESYGKGLLAALVPHAMLNSVVILVVELVS